MDKSHILQCVKIVREYGGIKLKKVSIKDVAREAGVSITTVSRALNGYMDISESTKKKIYAVVKQLDYVPNTNYVVFPCAFWSKDYKDFFLFWFQILFPKQGLF